MAIILIEDVKNAFLFGGLTINERFPECGFVYFPDGAPHTKENPNQGRVHWHVEKHEYPDTISGNMEKNLDQQFGTCKDAINVGMSWSRPTDKQMEQIQRALKLYVLYRRQQQPDYVWSIMDRVREEEAEVNV